MIIGKAIKIPRKAVVFNDKEYMAGYSEKDAEDDADALVSFMPACLRPKKITEMTIEDKKAKIVKVSPSLYIKGMWNFNIKFVES